MGSVDFQSYSTGTVEPKGRQSYWGDAIGKTYFPLSLQYSGAGRFDGRLTSWKFGDLSLSRLESDPLCYRRQRQHLGGGEENFLITIPEHHEVFFTQRGRSVQCKPGGFLLEHSEEPYEFSYKHTNALWVVKVPKKAVSDRVGSPDRFCATSFEATSGSGALFVAFTRLLSSQLKKLNDWEAHVINRQFLDLLALALENDHGASQSCETAVQVAHLQRIKHYIRSNLSNSDLSPKHIAEICGISSRYLHTLFKSTGCTVSQWIKEQRLQVCYDVLTSSAPLESIAQIAYQWGFSDQSHFCRVFKEHFGCSPSSLRYRYFPKGNRVDASKQFQ